MTSSFKKWWWKVLGVLVFLYVLIGGMTVPLGPGVLSVHPTTATVGEKFDCIVTGYNTHWKEAGENKVRIKVDSNHYVNALTSEVLSETKIKLTFIVPKIDFKPDTIIPVSVVFDNAIDGAFVHPNAIFVKQSDTMLNYSSWEKLEDIHFHHSTRMHFPYRNILNETVRNTFFHVALWFAMFVLLVASLYHAIKYLSTSDLKYDIQSAAFTKVAILFGVLGLITGSIWAKFTWNTFWTTDIKLNMSAIAMLIYFAYIIQRGSTKDQDKRAKTSAAYNIFAFVAMIPLLFVIPRLTDSLHPGNGGNPALGGEDLDNTLRLFFYPSIIALILIGWWLATLLIRYELIKEQYFTKR